MKTKKEKIISAVATIGIVLTFFGATYAYFATRGDAGKTLDVEITANTVDVFTFETGSPISFSLDQENFASGKGSMSALTFASAMLSANNKTNTATEHYYLYVDIQRNTFTYSKDTNHPEIIMNITSDDGTEITSLDGYNYTTVTDANKETYKGFDITNKAGVIEIFTNREITTTSSKTEKWNVTVTFINYDFNQVGNVDKGMKLRLMIQKEIEEFNDLRINVSNLATTYGRTGSITCSNSTASYNQKYNEISISNIGKYDVCNLTYTEPSSKTYLNDYVMSLAGTTQGNGKVVNETAGIPDYSTASTISEESYTNISTFSSTSSSSTSGTEVSNIFSYSNGQWTSDTSAMTSGTYYHFKFTPSESGYYQMCYELSSGSTSNYLYVYTSASSYNESASTEETIAGCIALGYISNSGYFNVSQYNKDEMSTLSFSVNKVKNINDINAGIRYEGKNPNNYIWFNNELWRIIGVFDENAHGQSNTNLVKIIRESPIGGLAWDKSESTTWEKADLNSLLNGAYLNAQDGTESGYCIIGSDGYIFGPTFTYTNCNYTIKGIQNGYRGMIQNVTWYLGTSYSVTSATAEAFYGYERGTNVNNGKPTSTTGYIGLMYLSDYGYSALSSSCARTISFDSYGNSNCAGQSWLALESTVERTISSVCFSAFYDFGVDKWDLEDGADVSPVLYLKSDVYYIDGDGSVGNPIIIGE